MTMAAKTRPRKTQSASRYDVDPAAGVTAHRFVTVRRRDGCGPLLVLVHVHVPVRNRHFA